MAEDEILNNIQQIASDSAKTGADLLMIILAAALVVGIIVGLIVLLKLMKSYKHIVKVRVVTNDRKYVIEDKAREIKQDGIPFWKLKKRKDLVQVPPPEATEITGKGGFYAECYYSEEEGYTWITDTGRTNGNFKAFTTTQRSLYVNRLRNAMLRKKKGIWDLLQQYVTPIILLVLVILILVFWQDLYKPIQETQEQAVKITQQQAFITEQQARITAVLVGDAEAGTLKFDQNIAENNAGASP